MSLTELSLNSGRTRSYNIAVKDDGGGAHLLTGCTLYFMAKRSLSDADEAAIIDKSSPATGIAILSETAGTARLDFLPSDTQGLEGDYMAALVLRTASNQQYRLWFGLLKVSKSVHVSLP